MYNSHAKQVLFSAMARLPAEHFSCKIDIELDIPYSKVSVCRPLRMEAVVGVHKLHIQSNIKVHCCHMY